MGHAAFEVDVSKNSDLQNVLQNALKMHGQPPTIVVNCAGITKDNFILKMTEKDFDDVIRVNLKVSC